MKKKKLLLFLSIITLLLLYCDSSEYSYVKGTVKDANNNYILSNVRVELLDVDIYGDEVEKTTYTDHNGEYRFELDLKWEFFYGLRLSKSGYIDIRHPNSGSLILEKGSKKIHDFIMVPNN